jgi:hypothetical protein
VKDTPFEGYLDEIFNSLEINKSVENLSITLSQINAVPLNLEDSNSLKFIEKNSSLKRLNFSSLTFSKIEMNILNEALMGNKSVTTLDLSQSNFSGPFEFLKKMKSFSFESIWKLVEDTDNFFQNLRESTSLTHLDLSMRFFDPKQIKDQVMEDFIEIMENHTSIISLVMKNNKMMNFQNLLNNPILEELTLEGSVISFENILIKLNSNKTLKKLNISNNKIINSTFTWSNSDELFNFFDTKFNWDEFKVTNKTLQKIQMTGNKFNFSKKFNLFKELLNIPSLEEFCIKFNKIGRNSVEYLCDFLKENSTLLKLEFNGKKKILMLDLSLKDAEVMKLFKDSLMKNKKLESLDFEAEYEKDLFTNLSASSWGEFPSKCLDIFLNEGEWTNKTLKELYLNCKIMTDGKHSFNTELKRDSFYS